MDMKENSAMTEASGLVNERGDVEPSSFGARPNTEAQNAGPRRPPQSPSPDAAMRWADQLREVTVKNPLQALFAAFLVGAWLARRR